MRSSWGLADPLRRCSTRLKKPDSSSQRSDSGDIDESVPFAQVAARQGWTTFARFQAFAAGCERGAIM